MAWAVFTAHPVFMFGEQPLNQPSDLVSLRGKTALVTGAAKRLGAATALRLAREGVHVVIHYGTSLAEAECVREQVEAQGVRGMLVQADLAVHGAGAALFEEALALAGPIDFLVNNASIFPEGNLADLDPDGLALNMQVNALAPLEIARALHAQQRSGAIVNLLDTRVNDYDQKHVAYHLSKRTLEALTRMMAHDYAPRVRVNAVAPGLALPPEGLGVEYLAGLAHTNPLQRFGSAEGIVEAIVFLLRSGFVTGQTIFVDGGRHLKGSFYG